MPDSPFASPHPLADPGRRIKALTLDMGWTLAYPDPSLWDTFARIPHHVPALDVGAVRDDGALVSLAGTGELYLLTDFRDGTLYADDLRAVAERGVVSDLDLARAETLARLLAEIHGAPGSHAGAYTRAIRDLLGHGEGIFGLVDSYPADGLIDPSRLARLEQRAATFRPRLRGKHRRVRRTHGDFHPYNVLFRSGVDFSVLDASRGCRGDPADDLAAMSVNYLFGGALSRRAWNEGLEPLWRAFSLLSMTGPSLTSILAMEPRVICNPAGVNRGRSVRRAMVSRHSRG